GGHRAVFLQDIQQGIGAMLEILNFPKERFLYLIPYTPIKYTLYSLPIYNLRYPIFKYTKSPVQMKIQFRTTSHLTTRRNIPEPTPPPPGTSLKNCFRQK
ncbi:hypothetical protein, partial [Alistipes putredinis]|uniref:hypothetical protein n=1 Tax=Alistipes putredinis TaxID=28117 RepID=UPI003AF595B7